MTFRISYIKISLALKSCLEELYSTIHLYSFLKDGGTAICSLEYHFALVYCIEICSDSAGVIVQ